MISLGITAAFLSVVYSAAQGDTLRMLCHRHYGRSDSSILRMVVDANPFVAAKLVLSAGDKVVLPAEPSTGTKNPPKLVALWDTVAFVGLAKTIPVKNDKKPTKVSQAALVAALESYRKRKRIPIPDEPAPEPRPPVPYNPNGLSWEPITDPYSIYNDQLAYLR